MGPTVTLYKVYPAPGVKIADIKKLQEDIALSLNAKGVRVVTLSDSVGIEVANDYASIVPLKALLNDDAFRNSKADLPVAIPAQRRFLPQQQGGPARRHRLHDHPEGARVRSRRRAAPADRGRHQAG